jgi:hypothetical protein
MRECLTFALAQRAMDRIVGYLQGGIYRRCMLAGEREHREAFVKESSILLAANNTLRG